MCKFHPVRCLATKKSKAKDFLGCLFCVILEMSNEKRAPGCLGYRSGMKSAQLYELYGDYFITYYKDPY